MAQKTDEQLKDLAMLQWEINKRLTRAMQYLLDPRGLTSSQLEILMSLLNFKQKGVEGEMTQITLSRVTFIDPMTTSIIIRNLEKKGLVAREASKMDARALSVQITEKGEKLLNGLQEEIDVFRKTLYKEVPYGETTKMLTQLLKNIKEYSIEYSLR